MLGEQAAHGRLVVERAHGVGRVEGEPEGVRLLGGGQHRGLAAQVQHVRHVVGEGGLADQGAQGGLVVEVGQEQLGGVPGHVPQVVLRLERRVPEGPHLESRGDGLLHQLPVGLDHEDPAVLGHCALSFSGSSGIAAAAARASWARNSDR